MGHDTKTTNERVRAGAVFVAIFTCVVLQLIAVYHYASFKVLFQPTYSSQLDIDFWVRRYLQWHDAHRHTAKRAAVFLPVPAGLGDNVVGMINLWGYAVLTNRLLLLDISEPYPLKHVLSERAIRRFVYDSKQDGRFKERVGEGVRLSVKAPIYRGVKKMLRELHPAVALHISISDRPDTIAKDLGFDDTQVPVFSRQVQRQIAHILLEPSREVIARIQSHKRQWQLDNNAAYLAVHARLGGVGEQDIERFRRIQGKYEKIASCLASRILSMTAKNGISSARVFVATDAPDFRTYFRKSMSEKSPGSMVYSMENDVHHFTAATNRSAQINLHVENILLGDAQHIIAFRSGFSNVAALRGRANITVIPMYACRV